MIKPICAALLVASFTGCVRYESKPLSATKSLNDFESRTLDAPALRQFVEKNRHTAPGAWPPAEWNFTNLVLAAYYYHPDMDTARAKWAVVAAGKLTAGERPNPTVSWSPGFNSTSPMSEISPWIMGFDVDIPIETAGKRGYRMAQAKELSESARFNMAVAAWQVRSRVRKVLLDMSATQETEALLKKQQALQTEIVKRLEGQLNVGAITPLEVTQARIIRDNLQLALADIARQQTEQDAQLPVVIGVPANGLKGVHVAFDTLKTPLPDAPSAEIRRQAMLNRADLLAILAEYAASESALQLEIAKQYPDLHVMPGYQLDQTDNKWTLGMSATVPVINQNRGPIAEAKAKRDEIASRFNALQTQIIGEVETALASYRAAKEKVAVVDSLVDSLNKQQQITQAMIDAGELAPMSALTTRLELNNHAISRMDAVIKAYQALAALEDAVQCPIDFHAMTKTAQR